MAGIVLKDCDLSDIDDEVRTKGSDTGDEEKMKCRPLRKKKC